MATDTRAEHVPTLFYLDHQPQGEVNPSEPAPMMLEAVLSG
jgi:hypothetical protein